MQPLIGFINGESHKSQQLEKLVQVYLVLAVQLLTLLLLHAKAVTGLSFQSLSKHYCQQGTHCTSVRGALSAGGICAGGRLAGTHILLPVVGEVLHQPVQVRTVLIDHRVHEMNEPLIPVGLVQVIALAFTLFRP